MSKKKAKNKKSKINFSELNKLGGIVKQIKNITTDNSLHEAMANINKMQAEVVKVDNFNILKNHADIYSRVSLPPDSETTPFQKITLPELENNENSFIANKSLVIGYLSDYYACGHFRMIYPFNSINALMTGSLHCMTSNRMITQDDLLLSTQAIWFQRPNNINHLKSIKAYKEAQKYYQYKIISDLDDFLWEIPEWNHVADLFTFDTLKITKECLDLSDEVVVSTVQLKNALVSIGVNGSKIRVIYNAIPKSLYGTDSLRIRFTDIKKPTILYNGGSSHFSETNDGDLGGVYKEFVLKYYKQYNFVLMGAHPSYMKPMVDSGEIKVIPYYNLSLYPHVLRSNRVDFIIAPLVENLFNSCKSDLKYIEASAVGAAFIGSEFEKLESPYTNAVLKYKESDGVEGLNKLVSNNLNKENYNSIIAIQHEYVSTRWTENISHLSQYMTVSNESINREDINRRSSHVSG